MSVNIFLRWVCRAAVVGLFFFQPTDVTAQKSGASEAELREKAVLAFEQKQFEDAAPRFSQLLSLNLRDTLLNYYYGASLSMLPKDRRSAVAYLEFAVNGKNVPLDIWYYYGRGLMAAGRFANAKESFEKFIASGAGDKAMRNDAKELAENCANADLLSRERRFIAVLEERPVPKQNFYASYSFGEGSGKVVPAAEMFLSSSDKEKLTSPVMFISADLQTIYLGSLGKKSGTGKDLFRVRKQSNGSWSTPEFAGNTINSEEFDDYPFMDRAGRTLYFSSKGFNSIGGYDIFRSEYDYASGQWSAPINMGLPINSTEDDMLFVPSLDGKSATYVTADNADPGQLILKTIELVQGEQSLTTIKGFYKSVDQQMRRDARISVVRQRDRAVVVSSRTDPRTGQYELVLPADEDYYLIVEGGGYVPHAERFSIPAGTDLSSIKQVVAMNRAGTDEQLQVTNYFTALDAKQSGTGESAGEVLTSTLPVTAVDSSQLMAVTIENTTLYVVDPNAKPVVAAGSNTAASATPLSDDRSTENISADSPVLMAEETVNADSAADVEQVLLSEEEIDESDNGMVAESVSGDITDEQLAQLALEDATDNRLEAQELRADAADLKKQAEEKQHTAMMLTEEVKLMDSTDVERKKVLMARATELAESAAVAFERSAQLDSMALDRDELASMSEKEAARLLEKSDKKSLAAASQKKSGNKGTLTAVATTTNKTAPQPTAITETQSDVAVSPSSVKVQDEVAVTEPAINPTSANESAVVVEEVDSEKSVTELSTPLSESEDTPDVAAKTNASDSNTTSPAIPAAVEKLNSNLVSNEAAEVTSTTTDALAENKSIDKETNPTLSTPVPTAVQNAASKEPLTVSPVDAVAIADEKTTADKTTSAPSSAVIAKEDNSTSEEVITATSTTVVVAEDKPTAKQSMAAPSTPVVTEAEISTTKEISAESTAPVGAVTDVRSTDKATAAESSTTVVAPAEQKSAKQETVAEPSAEGASSAVTETPRNLDAVATTERNETQPTASIPATETVVAKEAQQEESRADIEEEIIENTPAVVPAAQQLSVADEPSLDLDNPVVNDPAAAATYYTAYTKSKERSLALEQQFAAIQSRIESMPVGAERDSIIAVSADISGESIRQSQLAQQQLTAARLADPDIESKMGVVPSETTDYSAEDVMETPDGVVVEGVTYPVAIEAPVVSPVQSTTTNTSSTKTDSPVAVAETVVATTEASKSTATETVTAAVPKTSIKETSGIDNAGSPDSEQPVVVQAAESASSDLSESQPSAVVSPSPEIANEQQTTEVTTTPYGNLTESTTVASEQKVIAPSTTGNDIVPTIANETTPSITTPTATEVSPAAPTVADDVSANSSVINQEVAENEVTAPAAEVSRVAAVANETVTKVPATAENENAKTASASNQTSQSVDATSVQEQEVALQFDDSTKAQNYTALKEKVANEEQNTVDLFWQAVQLNKLASEERIKSQEFSDAASIETDAERKAALLDSAEEYRQQAIESENAARAKFAESRSLTEDIDAMNEQADALVAVNTTAPVDTVGSIFSTPETAPTFVSSPSSDTISSAVAPSISSPTEVTAAATPPAQQETLTGEGVPVKFEPVSEEKVVTAVSSTISLSPTAQLAYSGGQKIPMDEELPDGLVFKVQIGAFRQPVKDDAFGGIRPVSGENTRPGWIRYCVGLFRNFDPANLVKKEMQSIGYKDAFVVAYLNGKRISLGEANRYLAKQNELRKAELNAVANTELTTLQQLAITPDRYPAGTDKDEADFKNIPQTLTAPATVVKGPAPGTISLKFAVQVGVYRTATAPSVLLALPELQYIALENGLFKFTTGMFSNRELAALRKQLAVGAGVKDAFIVPYRSGVPVSTNVIAGKEEAVSDVAPAVEENPAPKETAAPIVETAPVAATAKIHYRIQLGAFRENVPLSAVDAFIRISDMGISRMQNERGLQVFYAGDFSDYESAAKAKLQVIEKGAKDAFVVGFNGEKRISLNEARQLQGR